MAENYTAPDGTKFIGITKRPDGTKHIERIEFASGISTYHNAVEHPDGTHTVERIEYHTVGGEMRGVTFLPDGSDVITSEVVLPDGEVKNLVQ